MSGERDNENPASGISLIEAERQRQIDMGYTPDHDLHHTAGLFAREAWMYARWAEDAIRGQFRDKPYGWPPEGCDWKPRDPLRALTKAGALIAAEIDRLLAVEGASPVAGASSSSSISPGGVL